MILNLVESDFFQAKKKKKTTHKFAENTLYLTCIMFNLVRM